MKKIVVVLMSMLAMLVAELLGRNEAELTTAAPAGTGNISEEHEAFDMNDFL